MEKRKNMMSFVLAFIVAVCAVLGYYSEKNISAAATKSVYGDIADAFSCSSSDYAADSIWNVPYYTALNADEPDANGNVTMWDYGYFRVYWWSSEGELLTARPQYIVVDDITYEYAGCEYFEGYTWDMIEKFRENGGIAFETCGGDDYTKMVYYYEPAASEGYTENIGESAVLEATDAETVNDYSDYEDVWYVAYYDAWGASESDANGAVTQWDYAYFTAHRWSRQGKKIASMPQYVVVDNVLYEYVSHWYSDYADASSYDWDVILKARANGGIVFQTCTTSSESDCETGILIVHYEPVDSDGYTEHVGESEILCDYDKL